MSERAAPMSSPCKPHKLIRNSPSNTLLLLLLSRISNYEYLALPLCPVPREEETWHGHHILLSTTSAPQCSVCPNLLHAFPSLPFPSPLSLCSFQEPTTPSSSNEAMSLAPSIPSIKVKLGRVVPPSSYRACRSFAVIRSSSAEGPRRPSAPPLSPPPPMPPKGPSLSSPPSLSKPPTPVKPAAPSPPPPETKPAASVAAGPPPVGGVVTFEYQRKVAKELQEYFKKKKLEETNQGPFFGWLAKNEISNGRWAMFGFAVGMLTEYATGSDFVEQMKILLSNFGIVDLD